MAAHALRRRRCAHGPETLNSCQGATGLPAPRILRIVSHRLRAQCSLQPIFAILANARTGRAAFN
jgi:hypothetical protein